MLSAVVDVGCVGFGVVGFECFGYAGVPGAVGVAGVEYYGVGWGGEDVAG